MIIKLYERLRAARKNAGLTQKELAQKLGIAYPTLSNYEKGHRVPDAELMARLALELNCDPGWLLTGEREKREVDIDSNLLNEIIVVVDEIINQEEVQIKTKKKAEIISIIYKSISKDEKQKKEIHEVAKRLVGLAV